MSPLLGTRAMVELTRSTASPWGCWKKPTVVSPRPHGFLPPAKSLTRFSSAAQQPRQRPIPAALPVP